MASEAIDPGSTPGIRTIIINDLLYLQAVCPGLVPAISNFRVSIVVSDWLYVGRADHHGILPRATGTVRCGRRSGRSALLWVAKTPSGSRVEKLGGFSGRIAAPDVPSRDAP